MQWSRGAPFRAPAAREASLSALQHAISLSSLTAHSWSPIQCVNFTKLEMLISYSLSQACGDMRQSQMRRNHQRKT